MRLVCPNCQAHYEIPDALIGGGGRRLRCARCAREWQAEAPTSEPPPPRPAAPMIEPAAAVADEPVSAVPPRIESPATVRAETRLSPGLVSRVEQRLPPRRAGGATVAVAWLLSLAILGAGVAAAYVWRSEVMAAWPPSQRLYVALGVR